MRIALLADMHGNPLALDAVLKDIQRRGGVEGYWILGDLCSSGFDPVGVLERLAALPNARFVRGNADYYITSDELPPPTIEQATENPAHIPRLVELVGSFGWVRGYVEGRGWLDWLAALPEDLRLTLPDGTRVLLVHCSPGILEGTGLHPGLSDAEIAALIDNAAADLICVAHFHMTMHRRVNGVELVNPGCVSNPIGRRDMRPAYAILEASATGHAFHFHRVDFDWRAAIEALERSGSPGAGYVLRFYHGQARAEWMERWDGSRHYPPVTD